MFSVIERFFANLSEGQRFIAFILILAVAVSLLAFVAGGWRTGVPVGLLILAILWLTKPLWKPAGSSSLQVRLTSLAIISGTALAILGKASQSKGAFNSLLAFLGIKSASAQQIAPPDPWISAGVLIFTLGGVFIVNWFTRDRSAMQKHPKSLNKEFPEQDYDRQLARFSEILLSRLNMLDEETKWDDYFFAPLEAEVEVLSGRRSKQKVVDLMHALREDRTSRIILVLGDPGSGKSVALRKLAKELLKEVKRTGRVPVYVNLKEWTTQHMWTKEAPPTAQNFREFILHTLKAQSLFADQFLATYFDRMVDRGRFFFLLDSFDEIPGVLDVGEASWLIQQLSTLMTEFFVSQDSGRGIVASRVYRRPKLNRAESTTFEIRPFSDMRIHEALRKSSKLQPNTIEKLFTSRTELIPIARNPFSAALIRLYAEHHGGDLPQNQLEMYESYIRHRLQSSIEQIEKHKLTLEEIITGATDIAWCMFDTPELGLEVTVAQLGDLLPNVRPQSITSILRYAGLARLSTGEDARFSFVHRRINEYFVARRLLNRPGSIALDTIPTDSRYRDALALYCEVGEVEHIKAIADFCWQQVPTPGVSPGSPEHLRSVHCLRFLRDAFRTRPECIGFLVPLASYIRQQVLTGNDLLSAKIVLEATGLLPETLAEPILIDALKMEDPWISETTLHACRHRKMIGEDLRSRLHRYLENLPVSSFLRRYQEIVFSLSLSDSFHVLRRYCVLRYIDNRMLLIGITSAVIFTLPTAINAMLVYSWLKWIARKKMRHALLSAKSLFMARTYLFVMLVGPTLTSFLGIHGLGPRPMNNRLVAEIAAGMRIIDRVDFLHLFHARSAVLLVGIVGSLCYPWLDIIGAMQRWRRLMSWSVVKEYALFGLSVIIGSGAIFGLVIFLAKRYGKAVLVISLAVVSIVGLYAVFNGVAQLIVMWKDRQLLKAVTQSTAVSRATIGSDFWRFKTDFYRLRYVEWLRDMQVQPSGAWLIKRPYFANDPASTMLAQLDERWLGIDV